MDAATSTIKWLFKGALLQAAEKIWLLASPEPAPCPRLVRDGENGRNQSLEYSASFAGSEMVGR